MFTFGQISNFEIDNMNNTLDSLQLINCVPEFSIFNDALKTNEMCSNGNDIDENLVYSINSKYYSCPDFYNINNSKDTFKLHHTNVNGYSSHADILKDFLVQSKVEFDAICISETSLQIDQKISSNDLLTNYTYTKKLRVV